MVLVFDSRILLESKVNPDSLMSCYAGTKYAKNTTKTTVFIICIQIIYIKIVCSQYIRPIKIGGTKTIFKKN